MDRDTLERIFEVKQDMIKIMLEIKKEVFSLVEKVKEDSKVDDKDVELRIDQKIDKLENICYDACTSWHNAELSMERFMGKLDLLNERLETHISISKSKAKEDYSTRSMLLQIKQNWLLWVAGTLVSFILYYAKELNL